MDARTIIEFLAKGRRVEILIEGMAKHPLTADLKDLAQMVYEILLLYDEEKIIELWDKKEINYFIVAIIRNQMMSSNSPYYKTVLKFRALSESIEHKTFTDDEQGK